MVKLMWMGGLLLLSACALHAQQAPARETDARLPETAVPAQETAAQRRAALRAALQARGGAAVPPEAGASAGVRHPLSPQEREALRQQLRLQRQDAPRTSP